MSNPAALQAVVYTLVAAAGLGVVLERDPFRQSMLSGIFGVCLGVLFLVFQAPDVALSEIVVGSFVVPVLVLVAVSRTRGDGS